MAKLIKVEKGELQEEFLISKPELRIGRASDNDIVLHDETVSAYHAVIVEVFSENDGVNKQYSIRDLGSTNKTHVNDKEVSDHTLKDNDIVRVGLAHFEFYSNNADDIQKEFQKTTKLHKSWIPGVFYTKN